MLLIIEIKLYKKKEDKSHISSIPVEKKNAVMYLRGVWLLILPNSFHELVKHKLASVDVISESILMDGMPQVLATIESRCGG